jgi:hypothetical protein
MNFHRANFVPEPLLWVFAIPFIILLFPIGILYCLICLIHAKWNKISFETYRHDILFSIIRPGFYVGIFVSFLFLIIITFPKRLAFKSKEKRRNEDIHIKRTQCIAWLEQFPFIQVDQYKPKIYISKGRAVGRLNIHVKNDQEKAKLIEKKSELPDNIYLEVFTVEKKNIIN